MKRGYRSLAGISSAFLLLSYGHLLAQCSVVIKPSGTSGDMLKAYTSATNVQTLTWQLNGNNIYTAYFSGFNIKGTTVAGGRKNGDGSDQLYGPADVWMDGAGNLYVLDAYNNRVQKWGPGATNGITVAGGNGEGSAANQLFLPQGFCVDGKGNIYIADLYNHRVQKWVPGGKTGITVAGGHGYGSGANQLAFPRDVYVDTKGNLYIADGDNNRVQKWAPGATSGVTVAGGNGFGSADNQLNAPFSIFVDGHENVYVSDRANFRVQKWAAGSKTGVTVAGGSLGSDSTQLNNPKGIFVDQNGAVYVADYFNNRIQKWLPGAKYGITVAGLLRNGHTALQFFNPSGVFVSPSGDLLVADEGNNRVQKFQPSDHINRDFIPENPGTYRVIAAFENGCIAISPDTLIGRKEAGSLDSGTSSGSIAAALPTTAMLVYPNPVHHSATVRFSSAGKQKYSISLSDMSGKTVWRSDGMAAAGLNKVELAVNRLVAGIYLLTVTKGEKERESLRVIKE